MIEGNQEVADPIHDCAYRTLNVFIKVQGF